MLQDTGERVIPDNMKSSNGLLLEHMARYHFTLPYIKGRVLDMACGSGYGAQLLAKQGKKTVTEVVGIDTNQEAITYARGRYYHPKFAYYCENATDSGLNEKLGLFDTIVSFETYEHIEAEEQFLSNLFQLLKPGGKLILSTPFGKGRGVECGSPFHVHQITVREFTRLFKDYPYKKVEFYFQRGVVIEPPIEDRYYPLGLAVCEK
ncbi:MAG: class I SAM-dependent methyltransferase [Bacillota bacterium]